MLSFDISNGQKLALVSWNGHAWIIVWTQKGDLITPQAKSPLREFIRDLNEEDKPKLQGLPLNVVYDETFKKAFNLY